MAKPKATDLTPAASTPTNPGATHTWEALVHAVPEPIKAQQELYAIRTAPAALIERGTHIRSEKIRTDLVRLCGIAAEFYPKATAAQPQLLPIATRALFSPARKRAKAPTAEAPPAEAAGEITAKNETSGGKKPSGTPDRRALEVRGAHDAVVQCL